MTRSRPHRTMGGLRPESVASAVSGGGRGVGVGVTPAYHRALRRLPRAAARVYAGPAALHRAAGFDSPKVKARKRPSSDAGAFLFPGGGRGLRVLLAGSWRAARGSLRARRPLARSVNPASSATSFDSAVADSMPAKESIAMSTRNLAARARPSNVIPFPSHRSRRAPAPAVEFDPFDAGLALAARDFRDCLLREGFSPADVDAIAADLAVRCAEIIAEERGAL